MDMVYTLDNEAEDFSKVVILVIMDMVYTYNYEESSKNFVVILVIMDMVYEKSPSGAFS